MRTEDSDDYVAAWFVEDVYDPLLSPQGLKIACGKCHHDQLLMEPHNTETYCGNCGTELVYRSWFEW